MVWKDREKRRYTRAVIPCRIEVGSPSQLLISHTENIGEGGVRVFLEGKLKLLTTVDLKIFLEKGNPIKCKGKVVWVAERLNPLDHKPLLFDTGIEFTEMDEPGKQYIRQLVDTVLTKEKIFKASLPM